MLSKLYFSPAGEHTLPKAPTIRYKVVRVKKHGAVLLDPLTGPVCALHFVQGFISTRGAFGTRGAKPGLIGVTTTDGQVVKLVLTNLQHKGDLGINICKGSTGGKAINAVNVIRPRETVVVDSDYSDGERQLILRAMTASVQQDEAAAAAAAPAGTYFYVTVTPEAGGDLTKARWTCPDYIVFESKRAKVVPRFSSPSYSASAQETYDPLQSMVQYESEVQQSSSRPLPGDDYELGMQRAPATDTWGSVAKAAKLEHGDVKRASTQAIHKEFDFHHSSPVAELCLSVLFERVVQYRPRSDAKVRISDALDALKDYLAGGHQRMLDILVTVYPEADCCLCLEPMPNAVFAKCGHACVHLACVAPTLVKCPLCRANILATIKM